MIQALFILTISSILIERMKSVFAHGFKPILPLVVRQTSWVDISVEKNDKKEESLLVKEKIAEKEIF